MRQSSPPVLSAAPVAPLTVAPPVVTPAPSAGHGTGVSGRLREETSGFNPGFSVENCDFIGFPSENSVK